MDNLVESPSHSRRAQKEVRVQNNHYTNQYEKESKLYKASLYDYFTLFKRARRFFSFHLYLLRAILGPQVLLSNFIFSLWSAMNHASLFPLWDTQTPGSSSSLYPLFLSSLEASCLVNMLPPVSWITRRFWHSLAYRSRGGRGRVAGCSGGGLTSGAITSPVTMAVMIVMVIMMYV